MRSIHEITDISLLYWALINETYISYMPDLYLPSTPLVPILAKIRHDLIYLDGAERVIFCVFWVCSWLDGRIGFWLCV